MQEKLIRKDLAVELMPHRKSSSHKGKYGTALLIGGNKYMGGAIQMAAQACVYSGIGKLTVATDEINIPAIHAKLPEAMVASYKDFPKLKELINSAEIILLGPGLGLDKTYFIKLLRIFRLLGKDKSFVLDADALNLLAFYINNASEKVVETINAIDAKNIVITPHIGEWQRLTANKIDKYDHEAIKAFIEKYNFNLILKDSRSRIYLPNKDYYYLNSAGNPGMAVGGMGDTLAGIITSFLGKDLSLEAALILALFIHSYTADLIYEDEYTVIPSKLAKLLPKTMKSLENEKTKWLYLKLLYNNNVKPKTY